MYAWADLLLGYKFYNNPNALGLGMVSSPSIEDVSLSEDNPFENQNMVFNALAGTTKEYFTKIPVINSEMENVSTSQLTDGHTKSLYNKNRNQTEKGDADDASNKPENESSDPASRHRCRDAVFIVAVRRRRAPDRLRN